MSPFNVAAESKPVALNVATLEPVKTAPCEEADLLPKEPSRSFIVLNSVVLEILVSSS